MVSVTPSPERGRDEALLSRGPSSGELPEALSLRRPEERGWEHREGFLVSGLVQGAGQETRN